MPNKNQRLERANEVFWNSLTEIQTALSISDESLADIAGLKSRSLKTLRSKNQSIKLPQLCSICDELEVDSLKLFKGEIDIDLLKTHIRGEERAISQTFLDCPNSKAFTVKNILKHIREFNPEVEKGILRSLQIRKLDIFENDNLPISVSLPGEIMKMASFFFSDEVLSSWGMTNSLQFKDSLFGKQLQKARSTKELFDIWLPLEKYLETNWRYDIAHNDGVTVIINGHPSGEMLEHHKRKDYGSQAFNWFRAGFLPGLLYYIDKIGAKVTFTKSIHQGDDYDQFYVDLSEVTPLSSSHQEHFLH